MNRNRKFLVVAATTCLVLALGVSCAFAQNDKFVDVNRNIYRQFTAVPQFFKQITVLISLLTTIAGIHGIYKGGADPRASAPVKNIFMIVIGGLMLAISSVALIAEKSTFGTNDTTNAHVSGSKSIDDKLYRFNPY